jgi:hypothetical protein
VPTSPSATPIKPQAVAESAPAKPIPQATIKLQPAPAPAAARKPASAPAGVPVEGKKDSEAQAPKKVESKPASLSEAEEAVSTGSVPLPFLLAAAALALIAFGIQLWTFLS